jgi:hypothetical protein
LADELAFAVGAELVGPPEAGPQRQMGPRRRPMSRLDKLQDPSGSRTKAP